MKTNYFKGTMILVLLLTSLAGLLFLQKSGQKIWPQVEKETILSGKQPTSKEIFKSLDQKVLLLSNSQDETSKRALDQYQQILKDMRVGYQVLDVSKQAIPDFKQYERVIVLLANLDDMRESVFKLVDWTQDGGQTLFGVAMVQSDTLSAIQDQLGIAQAVDGMAKVESISFSPKFMIGSGRNYRVSDPFESAYNAQLGQTAELYAWTGGQHKVPLVWRQKAEKGTFVVANIGIYEKATRGFYAAAYSLLGRATAYPVVNGAVYYLDDFPSPVPMGDAQYIKRDYQVSIQDFYTNIWWPDVKSLGSKYGIRHTGGLIENYGNETTGQVVRQDNVEGFRFFGKSLLQNKGEIAYHGYNHQPFSLDNIDYGKVFPDYKHWSSKQAMKKAMQELIDFGEELYPGTNKSVYIPPSNVLSQEGRELLGQDFPMIKAIASNYFEGDLSYVQEFEIADDGIVEMPRVASGAFWDDYMTLSVVSELNMHFVSSHFLHPDDTLDEDRGAKEGWKKMFSSLDKELAWIHKEAAPQLRQLTGSEMAGAVQRYSILKVKQTEEEHLIRYQLENFKDHAYLYLRLNQDAIDHVSGGRVQELGPGFYLLKAESDKIEVDLKE